MNNSLKAQGLTSFSVNYVVSQLVIKLIDIDLLQTKVIIHLKEVIVFLFEV